jgi:hypothetical protein
MRWYKIDITFVMKRRRGKIMEMLEELYALGYNAT